MHSTGGSNGDTWNMARCILQEAVMETLGTWHGAFYDKLNSLFNGKLNVPFNVACFCVLLIKAKKVSKLVHVSLLWPLCAC